jgi:catalase
VWYGDTHEPAAIISDSRRLVSKKVGALMKALKNAGATADVVGPHLGPLGNDVVANKTFTNSDMVLYDAVFVPGGAKSVTSLVQKGDAHVFIDEAYKQAKPIAAIAEGVELLTASEIGKLIPRPGSADSGATQVSPTDTSGGVQSLSEVGRVLQASGTSASQLAALGIIVGQSADLQNAIKQFLDAIAHHRFWGRPRLEQVPA